MKYARLRKIYQLYRNGNASSRKSVDIAAHIAPLISGAEDITDEEFIEICYLAYSPHKVEPTGVKTWVATIDEKKRGICGTHIHDGIKRFYEK